MRSPPTGSRRSGRTSTPSRREVAAAVGVGHAVALVERHRGAPPRADRPRRRRGRRGACSTLHVRGQREPDHLRRARRRCSSTATRRPGRSIPRCSTERSPTGARPGGRVRAVIAVDLYGQCCDYDAHRRGLRAPRRAAHRRTPAEALGATYRGAPAGGQFGALGVFSFNGNKIITTTGGGMLVSGDDATGSSTRAISSTQAREPAPHYEHLEIGFNYRMSNLLAALGRAQLADARRPRRRAPADPRPLPRAPRRRARHHVHARGRRTATSNALAHVRRRRPRRASAPTARRSALALEAEDIEARPVWKPMHLQPVFAGAHVVRRRRRAARSSSAGSACRAARR